MKLAGKDLGYYWSIVKKPLMIYVLVCILVLAAAFVLRINELFLLDLFFVVFGAATIPAYLGLGTVKHKAGGVGNAAIAGAFFALVLCCGSLIILAGIVGLGFLFIPDQLGNNVGGLGGVLKDRLLSVFIGLLFLSPVYTVGYAIYSALSAGFLGFAAQQSMKKKPQ